MALFAVTFRIDDGPDYAKRWQSVVDAIKKEAIGPVWDEPTSFHLFQSNQTSKQLCDAIYYGSVPV